MVLGFALLMIREFLFMLAPSTLDLNQRGVFPLIHVLKNQRTYERRPADDLTGCRVLIAQDQVDWLYEKGPRANLVFLLPHDLDQALNTFEGEALAKLPENTVFEWRASLIKDYSVTGRPLESVNWSGRFSLTLPSGEKVYTEPYGYLETTAHLLTDIKVIAASLRWLYSEKGPVSCDTDSLNNKGTVEKYLNKVHCGTRSDSRIASLPPFEVDFQPIWEEAKTEQQEYEREVQREEEWRQEFLTKQQKATIILNRLWSIYDRSDRAWSLSWDTDTSGSWESNPDEFNRKKDFIAWCNKLLEENSPQFTPEEALTVAVGAPPYIFLEDETLYDSDYEYELPKEKCPFGLEFLHTLAGKPDLTPGLREEALRVCDLFIYRFVGDDEELNKIKSLLQKESRP